MRAPMSKILSHESSHATFIRSVLDNPDLKLTTSLRWTTKSDSFGPTSPADIDTFLDGLPLRLHAARLRTSIQAFSWGLEGRLNQHDLEGLLCQRLLEFANGIEPAAIHDVLYQSQSLKLRVEVSQDGSIDVVCPGMTPMNPPIYPFTFSSGPFTDQVKVEKILCRVNIANKPTTPSMLTQHKTTSREMYDEIIQSAQMHGQVPTWAEVLVYNTEDEIMEATSSTVYFLREGAWITPAEHCGGNLGTTRAWALEHGWCQEGVVSLSEARPLDGQLIWLSNAVRGFWPAILCLDDAKWKIHVQKVK